MAPAELGLFRTIGPRASEVAGCRAGVLPQGSPQSAIRNPESALEELALFCRSRGEPEFIITPFPEDICPSDRLEENWLCFARNAADWNTGMMESWNGWGIVPAGNWLCFARPASDWNAGTME